ncbi:MAG: hypothetical protein JNM94_06235 [Phycisphaerae bacterium]|nr:hypothetical protein [Phycisphaerae bacterium]
MRTITRLTGIRGDAAIARLSAIVPEAEVSVLSIFIELDEGDPRLKRVLYVAREFGWQDRRDPPIEGREPRYYRRRSWRVYDDSDLDPCQLLTMEGLVADFDVIASSSSKDERLRVDVDRCGLPEHLDVSITGGSGLIVPDRVYRVMHALPLRRLLFRPTVPYDRRGWPERESAWEDIGPPWWEITSDLKMPPVAPSLMVLDHKKKPVDRSYNKLTIVKDPTNMYLGRPELRYLRSELPPLDSFDAALSYEHSGCAIHGARLIVSQRLRRAWIDAGFKADWMPVHIEEG